MHPIGRALCINLLLISLIACGLPGASAVSIDAVKTPRPQITVFAAASLTEAFTEIGQGFERSHGIKVLFNFAGSQQLVQQLTQGAPADVFASASAREMDSAVAAGVINRDTPRIFALNRLVVIVPRSNPARIERFQDLARTGLKLALAADQVPVGRYAQQALTKMSGDPAFGADFKQRVDANVVSHEENVKAVVTKVSLDEADAGIVYASDVTTAVADKLGTIAIPDAYNQIAEYPIAPTQHPPAGDDLARSFAAYVLSPDGQSILRRYGFMPAPD